MMKPSMYKPFIKAVENFNIQSLSKPGDEPKGISTRKSENEYQHGQGMANEKGQKA